MYRFLWRPAWIVSHVLILCLIVAMVNLGLWQLRRLDERQALNAQVEQNAAAAPLSLDQAVASTAEVGAEEMRYRRVRVVGRYEPASEVAIRSRSLDGAPGRWVATPLVPADGSPAVLVVRGWIPQAVDDTDPPIAGVEPPEGQVEVVGYLQEPQRRGSFGSVDPAEGVLGELSRVDVERFASQYDGVVSSFWLQLADQDPPTTGPLLQTVPLPPSDDGPHLSYAVQWFIFATIAIVGYPLILRRVARQRAADDAASAADGDQPGEEVQRAGAEVG